MLTAGQIEALRARAEALAAPVGEQVLKGLAKCAAQAGQIGSPAAYRRLRAQMVRRARREAGKAMETLVRQAKPELRSLAELTAAAGRLGRPTGGGKASGDEDAAAFMEALAADAARRAEEELAALWATLGAADPYGSVQPLEAACGCICDFAFHQARAGAAGYEAAVRRATKNAAALGVRSIDRETGEDASLAATVGRGVMGELARLQERISQWEHDRVGCDGWEISAHAASAPDHEPIQGRQYSDAAYKALNNALARRIGTLNCGHTAFPVILGVSAPQYTAAELKQLREDNEKGVTVDGKHRTLYEATQVQRRLERAVRLQERRIQIDEAAGDTSRLELDRLRRQRLEQEYVRFSRRAGLRTR